MMNVFLVASAVHGAHAAAPVVGLLAWQRAIAGMSAYMAATIVSSPVDVVKTRLQAAPQQQSQVEVVRSMVMKDGLTVFFAGIGPAMLMAPAAVVQYTLLDPLREIMPLFAAAIIAGTLDITLKCPFDRLKTQLQSGSGGEKKTASALLRATYRANGIRGLWSGYGATLARDVPYLVLKWLTYTYAQSLLVQVSLGDTMRAFAGARNLVAGAIAGAVAATAVTPADVIKTRMQVKPAGAVTASEVAREIFAEGGAVAFFRGLGPRLMRIPVYTAVTLATFDLVKDLFSAGVL